MWNFVVYIIAVVIGLFLYWSYDEEQAECARQLKSDTSSQSSTTSESATDFKLSSIFSVLGLNATGETHEEQFESFTEHFTSFDEVAEACWRAGLESSSLVIGVDFTASNEWKGRKSFNQSCLHKLVSSKVVNPYQKVIAVLGQSLAPFDDDNKIPAYGFGDAETRDHSVFSFRRDQGPCNGFQEVLEVYSEVVKRVSLSGPSSLAPIINKAVDIVRETRKYHILVIITDGQITQESSSIDAIVNASNVPLSIVAVGVGDGPWDTLRKFDARLSRRRFDNFRFVDYHRATAKTKSPDLAFALHALMEIPDQYKRIKELGYLDSRGMLSKDLEFKESSGMVKSDECIFINSGTDIVKASPWKVPEDLRHRHSTISF